MLIFRADAALVGNLLFSARWLAFRYIASGRPAPPHAGSTAQSGNGAGPCLLHRSLGDQNRRRSQRRAAVPLLPTEPEAGCERARHLAVRAKHVGRGRRSRVSAARFAALSARTLVRATRGVGGGRGASSLPVVSPGQARL